MADMTKIDERLKEIDNGFTEYLHSLGVAENKSLNIEEIRGYLNMDRHELAKLSRSDALEIAYRLGQLSLEILKEHNRNFGRAKWANSQIGKMIASQVGTYNQYAPYEERKNRAMKENDAAAKLNEIMIAAYMKADSLNYLSKEINNLADTLKLLQREKITNA